MMSYRAFRGMKARVNLLVCDESGMSTVEYAIAGGLVGAAVIAAFIALGDKVGEVIEYITGKLQTPG